MEVIVIVFKMPKKITKKSEKKRLDEAWKLKVKERDCYFCQVCNKLVEKKNCQAHHILPRHIKRYRWDVDNGITLCYVHHKIGPFSAHQNAIWFTFWLKTHKKEQFWKIINKLKEIGKHESSSN